MSYPLIVVLTLLLSSVVSGATLDGGCEEVQKAYVARGLHNVHALPHVSRIDTSLQLCPSSTPTCCTSQMEENLGLWATQQYRQVIETKAKKQIVDTFRSKAKKVDDFLQSILSQSEYQLHDVFTRTYGILYERNADLFQKLFKELKSFYIRGDVDVGVATMEFFTSLYQKTFQVINSQYNFDDSYLTCMSKHMPDQKPFGDIPTNVAVSVKNAMVANEAIAKAIKTAANIIDEVKMLPSSDSCTTLVQKMNACPTCQGLPEMKPCNQFCVNVMQQCLGEHIKLQQQWDKFIESLVNLSDRLSGPFNAETIILPLDINISEAIMTLQENRYQISQKVFQICGTPSVMRRRKRDADAIWRQAKVIRDEQDAFNGFASSGNRKSLSNIELDKMTDDIKNTAQKTLGFWTKLPEEMCLTDEKETTSNCYSETIEVVEESEEPSPLNEQILKLRSISNQLRQALRGQDVEWWEPQVEAEAYHMEDRFFGSGDSFYSRLEGSEGSGYGYSDDEDDWDEEEDKEEGSGYAMWDFEEGSGDKQELFPTTTTSTTTTTTTTTKPEEDIIVVEEEGKIKEDDKKITEDDRKTSGASGNRVSRWEVFKAVVLFVLPQMACYLPTVFALI